MCFRCKFDHFIIFAIILFFLTNLHTFALATTEESPNLLQKSLYSSSWKTFKRQFSKTYSSDLEEEHRFRIWLKNKKLVEKHNSNAKAGKHSYSVAINKYSDKLSHEIPVSKIIQQTTKTEDKLSDFKNPIIGDRNVYRLKRNFKNSRNSYASINVPTSIDWRKYSFGGERGKLPSCVGAVKTQGQCLDCWAFADVGATESAQCLWNNNSVVLSEQNLLDCETRMNYGCKVGGTLLYGFQYISQKGVDKQSCYPYVGSKNNCSFKSNCVGAKVDGVYSIPNGDEQSLKVYVGTMGPAATAINAAMWQWIHYASGVFDEPSCSTNLSHGVIIDGYGSESGKDYWLVRNSWGQSWGDEGYIKMARNKNNQCGIVSEAFVPYLKDKTPKDPSSKARLVTF